ncbi:hypothetical protein Plhal304r1_c036g0111481 [Plasmopara halstedii]
MNLRQMFDLKLLKRDVSVNDSVHCTPRQVVATKIPSSIALAFVFVLALHYNSVYRSRVHAHGSVCNSHKGVIAYDQILICALPKNPILRLHRRMKRW